MMFKKSCDILYKTAVHLLVTFAILVVMTSILWLIKLPMLWFYLPISYIIALLVCRKLLKYNRENIILVMCLGIVVIGLCILLSGHVYDQSDDGNTYHKETIGMITKGWNPIWDDYDEYAINHNLVHSHSLWAKHYPKTTWIIGSSIYMLTNNIESAKSYNLLFIFIGFGILLYSIFNLLNQKFASLLITSVIVFNPIVMTQLSSLYLDGTLGILLFIIVIKMIDLIKKGTNADFVSIMSSALILIINVKFTGLAYAGIFCLGYYIYYAIKKVSEKKYTDIVNITLYFIVVVLISVLVVGSNSYVKNIITNGHPFYPLMGENKVDIMTYLQPESFQKMSPLMKNYYAIFSKTANIGMFNHGEPVLKIPFLFDFYELSQIGYDTRIGGYGVLFSGIFLIAGIIDVYFLIRLLIKKKYDDFILMFISILIIILLMLFLSDGWWARYAPYLYIIIILSTIFLAINKRKLSRILMYLFIFLISCNSFISFCCIIRHYIPASGMSRNNLSMLSGHDINIYLYDDRFSGILYNLDDYDIKYHIVKEKTDNMNKLYGNFIYYE